MKKKEQSLSPHDQFFKENFSQKDEAVSFLKEVLPLQIKSNIDFDSLEIDNQSFTDKELKEYFSDIVYHCRYKASKELKISILFEHKSYFVKYPHIQLLKYMIKLWEYDIKQKRPIQPVIPIIVYHGKEKWEKKPLSAFFNDPESDFKSFIPDFDYILSDLSRYTDEEIKNQVFDNLFLKTALLVMKNIFDDKKILANLIDYFNIAKIYYEEERGLKFLEAVIRYLFYTKDEAKQEVLIKIIEQIPIRGEEIAMTIAEKYIHMGEKRGEEKGKIEGKIEGKIATAVKMIQKKYDIQTIAELTELPLEEIKKLSLSLNQKSN